MYIGSPFMLDTDLGQPVGKAYKPPFEKGAQLVAEADAQKLLTIVRGPSPYEDYIKRADQRINLPARFFRIITSVKQAPEYLRGNFAASAGSRVGGTVDRCTTTIYMTEPPKQRNATYLELALHELIHLFGHVRLPRPCKRVVTGTFQASFGRGVGEGVTQHFTERLMHHQKIALYSRERIYENFTKPVRELIQVFGEEAFAAAYFDGEVAELVKAMNRRWGSDWHNVAALISREKPKQASAEIKRLEAAHIDRLLRKGVKGDFPTPSPCA